MKKVFQDKDNCLDACLATLLGITLKDVPETRWLAEKSEGGGFWFKEINDWLIKKHKSRLIWVSKKDVLMNIGGGYKDPFILVIKGDYGKDAHAVIVNHEMKIIHDPAHPAQIKRSFTETYGMDVKTQYALFLTKN